MRFTGVVKKIIIIMSILLIAFAVKSSPAYAYAEDIMELKGTIHLDNNTDDFTERLTMKRDGNIIFNFTVKDRDIKPSQISIQIKKVSDGTIVYEVDGITKDSGLVDLNIELDKGEYRIDYKLYNSENDFSDTYASIYSSINKTYRLIDSPKNIEKLTVNAIKQADEESTYNLISFGGALTELVLPFTTKNDGGIIVSLEGISNLEARIYEDKSCTKALGNNFEVGGYNNRTTDYYTRLPKGTYYLKFIKKHMSSYEIENFRVTLDSISEEDRSIKNKLEYLAYQDKFSGKTTYKISVPQGILQLAIKPLDNKVHDATIQLYDKNMKKLTPKDNITAYNYNNGNTMYQNYSLKKGTYYVQLETKCGFYTIQAETITAKNMNGSSKSAAKNISNGGGATGNLFVTDAKTDMDWFKFTLKSRMDFNFDFTFYSDGNVGFDVINSKGKVVITMEDDYKEGMYSFSGVYTLEKGAYYIKIHKKEKYSSMSYVLECSYY